MSELEIAKQAEFFCALTDLFFGIMLLPMSLSILFTKSENKKAKYFWSAFFFIFCISCLLGFVIHNLLKTQESVNFCWKILYPMMFLISYSFLLSVFSCRDKQSPTKKDVLIISLIFAVFFTFSCVLIKFFNINSMVAFTALNIPLAVFGFVWLLIKLRKKSTLFVISLIPILCGAAAQFCSSNPFKLIYYIDNNTVTHLFLIIGMIILFFSVLKYIKEN